MNAGFRQIAARIRGETIDLEIAVQRTQKAWKVVQKGSNDQDVYLDSVALNLHSFYSGIEGLFEVIAREIDKTVPVGDSWHRDLLDQMARDIPDKRPALMSTRNAARLNEFMRFRHLVRNVYAANLVPERMSGMLGDLPGLWSDLKNELLAFAKLLEQAS